jgi:RHS repeat-associated protein
VQRQPSSPNNIGRSTENNDLSKLNENERSAQLIRRKEQSASASVRPEPVEGHSRGGGNPDRVAATYSVLYFHNDQIGTPRELTDQQGHIRWAATYKTWGNVESEYFGDTSPNTTDDFFLDGNTVKKVSKPRASASVGGRNPNAVDIDRSQSRALSTRKAANDGTGIPHPARGEPVEPRHQPLRFQGQYFDEETGLHYNRFRYYDPDYGRVVNQDPIGLFGGTNSFSYAPNPNGWIDPFGLNGTPGICACPCSGTSTSGLMKLIGAGDDPQITKSAGNVKTAPGTIDVLVHGSPDKFWVHRAKDDWVALSHRDLATFMKKNGWKPGSPVRLLSCSTGANNNGAAKNLANKLGVPVTAPSDTLWLFGDGKMTIGKGAYDNTGVWNVFKPGKP